MPRPRESRSEPMCLSGTAALWPAASAEVYESREATTRSGGTRRQVTATRFPTTISASGSSPATIISSRKTRPTATRTGSSFFRRRRTRAWTRAQGANDRVRLGLIGCGTRGAQVSNFFLKHADAQYVAAADVFKTRLDNWITTFRDKQNGATIEPCEDYRRILDRKDVDA